MTNMQKMIYGYIRMQFDISKARILLTGEKQFQVDFSGETLTLTCDDQYNIIDSASGEIIAKRMLDGWRNVPGKFWK